LGTFWFFFFVFFLLALISLFCGIFFSQVTLISSKAPLYIFPRIHFFFEIKLN
jgi:hypothetical protein